ncbi:FimD/PapC C-terminal domain-containing protein [Rosenbergiella nectarea]|uniref:FimD/PapC C-terminal domain-containing protein n=1 Tax=Rosenbergiella nectarea TaxID=988801 RepID=UPI003527427D
MYSTTPSLVSVGESSGIVDDNSETYLSGIAREGTGIVKWGVLDGQQCKFHWSAPKANPKDKSIQRIKAECL